MTERLRFVERLQRGERMTDLCAEFGISRKTGYKVLARYEAVGVMGLGDEPRVPKRIPHRTTPEVEALVVKTREKYPTWGPRKLRSWLCKRHPGVGFPAPSTIGDLLQRRGLIKARRRRRRTPPYGGPLQRPEAANDVWCADFKGQFRVGNGAYCYPLTITDQYSRYLVSCEGLERIETSEAQRVFEWAFREHGLPRVMRTDNGAPFASRGLFGLSRLSVWWLRLGITPERIEPGHPEQNGQHERMHLTLKQETTRPAAHTLLGQQERFDGFRGEFNQERPHEALGQQPPATHYRNSERPFPDGVPELAYPLHDEVRTIDRSGHLSLGGRGRSVFLAGALAGEQVGLREVEDARFLVSFAHLDLGYVDASTLAWEPLDGDDDLS